MAKISTVYTIRNSRGELVATIPSGTRDTSTDLVLHGRGAPEYGLERDQNLVYLLENFSNAIAPDNPVTGQFWWKTGVQMYVWTGSPSTWTTLVPPPEALGFDVEAGDGLINGGFPTLSPLQTVLDVGPGTGITINTNDIATNDPQIVHDNLSGYSASRHTDHSSTTITLGTGFVNGGARPLNVSQTFDLGAGDGILSLGSPGSIAVDSTVVRTTDYGSPGVIQSIGGTKTFLTQIRAAGAALGATPSYSFSADSDTGIYLSGVNELSFVTGATQRLCITSAGALIAQTPNYETLVTEDDDIPNKKYVDDTISVGSAPTANTHVGTSSLSGLRGNETYLVSGWGVLPNKGTGGTILSSHVVRTGTGPLFLPDAGSPNGNVKSITGQRNVNWMDGQCPTFSSHVVEMQGDTTLMMQINSSFHGTPGDYGTQYINAVQLTNVGSPIPDVGSPTGYIAQAVNLSATDIENDAFAYIYYDANGEARFAEWEVGSYTTYTADWSPNASLETNSATWYARVQYVSGDVLDQISGSTALNTWAQISTAPSWGFEKTGATGTDSGVYSVEISHDTGSPVTTIYDGPNNMDIDLSIIPEPPTS